MKNLRLDNFGQISAELILVTLIFLVIAVGLIQLVNSEMGQTSTGNQGQIRMMGEQVAETINTVYINGPGYSANLTLPNLPNSTTAYTVNVNTNGSLNVIYNSNNIYIKLIPTNIQSKTMKNNGTTYIVKNNNGTITFT